MPTVTLSDDEMRWLEEAAKERGLPSASLMVSALINDVRSDEWWESLDEDSKEAVRAKLDRAWEQTERGETYSLEEAWELLQRDKAGASVR